MRKAKILAAFLAAAFLRAASAEGAARVSAYSGVVQLRPAGQQAWSPLKTVPAPLAEGDTVRTGSDGKATISFDGGTRVELRSNGSFTLEESNAGKTGLRLFLGTLRVKVERALSVNFSVNTPVAVCSVRGTEFEVQVGAGGNTTVDLYKGLLAVGDRRGQQVLLQPNQRVTVDLGGLGVPRGIPTPAQGAQGKFREQMKREMTRAMSALEVLEMAEREKKLAEYQQGKSLVDVNGRRVRLDEYILRPQTDQFKLVVVNKRDARLDYFYYLGTFNKDLPRNLKTALVQLPGGVDVEPEYFLRKFETGRSNTTDIVIEKAEGGHLVDVNNNASASDNVAFLFDSKKDEYVDVTGRKVYQTLFDKYGFYINSKLKYGWTGANIQSYDLATTASTNDPITGAALTTALPTRSVSTTFPDANNVRQVIYESYGDGSFTKWDNYIINDEGQVAKFKDFEGATSGAQYRKTLLKFNFEQIVTATEFEGRSIDLVVEPKILIEAGLVQ